MDSAVPQVAGSPAVKLTGQGAVSVVEFQAAPVAGPAAVRSPWARQTTVFVVVPAGAPDESSLPVAAVGQEDWANGRSGAHHQTIVGVVMTSLCEAPESAQFPLWSHGSPATTAECQLVRPCARSFQLLMFIVRSRSVEREPRPLMLYTACTFSASERKRYE